MTCSPYGPVTQVAWVTDDLDATEAALGPALGVAEWTRMPGIEFGPDSCTYRGAPADFVADISLAYAGDLQLELIRPARGDSIYTEFLAERGAGLHHVCCEVTDMEAALARARAGGAEIVQEGSMAGGLMRFAYLDVSAAGSAYLELAQVDASMRPLYDDIRRRSAGGRREARGRSNGCGGSPADRIDRS